MRSQKNLYPDFFHGLFYGALAVAVFYLWVISGTRFEWFAETANIRVQSLSLPRAAWALLLPMGVLISWGVHDLTGNLLSQRGGQRMGQGTGGTPRFWIRPLVNLGVSTLFWAIYLWNVNPLVSLFSYWMAFTHLIIGLGNLIPAAPTDAGKALLPALLKKWGPVRAEQIMHSLSQMTAFCLIAVGLIEFSPLILLLAVMTYAKSRTELADAFQQPTPERTPASVVDIGIHLPSISDRSSLLEAAELMVASQSEVLPVRRTLGLPEGSVHLPVKMIGLSDMQQVAQSDWATTPVRQVMHSVSQFVASHQQLDRILPALQAAPHQCLPWLDDEQIMGIIRYSDVPATAGLKVIHPDERKRHVA
ncbi:MAG: hypothetical protein H7222_08795 [Methylotenera sp.]|nr:hypothetical protein [Oligoflexia bacterium]